MPQPSGPNLASQQIRQQLIDLLDGTRYRVTKRALDDGLKILKGWGGTPTEWGLVEYALERLRHGHPIRLAPQGDPPGCHGMAYELKNADGAGLYIKMKIDEKSFGSELVILISFHY